MSKAKQVPKEKLNPDKAFEVHSRICERELARRALLVDNIKDLVWMFESQHYKAILGFNPPPQWSGYLGMIELYYSRSEIERWRKIWKYFESIDMKLDTVLDIPPTRLEDIAKIAPGIVEVGLLIGQAKQLPSLEWRNVLAEKQGKPTSDECPHTMEVFEICKKCGTKHNIQVPKE